MARAAGAWFYNEGEAVRVFSDSPLDAICTGDTPGAINGSSWLWVDDAGCASHSTLKRRKAVKCAAQLVFMGDSVMRQVSELLNCSLDLASPHSHIPIRSFFPKGARKQALQALESVASPKDASVVLNAAGLWQCAYGGLGAWRAGLYDVFQAAKDLGFKRIVWVQTTAVHPGHYFGDVFACDAASDAAGNQTALDDEYLFSKRAMTEPRVEVLNAIAAEVAAIYGIPVIDSWSPTALRADDPLTPIDMRHYGVDTMANHLRLILQAAC